MYLFHQSGTTLCDPMDCSPPGSSVHGDSPGKNTGSQLPCPPPRDFPNAGIKPQSLALQVDSLQVSHRGSLRTLEWGVYPFSRGTSWPRNWTASPALQADSFFFFFLICSGFCHTLKWNSHGFTCVPHPDPPSYLPLHPLPLGLPSAPGPSACLMHPTWAGDLFHPR